MAKTTRKRPEKTTKKTAKKATKKVAKKVEKLTHLNQQEINSIATLSASLTNAKLLMNLEEQALKNLNLNAELLHVKIDKQKEMVNSKNGEYMLTQKKYKANLDEVIEKYGLPKGKGFGFDPDTGEINPEQ